MFRPEMAIIRFLHRLRGFYIFVWGVLTGVYSCPLYVMTISLSIIYIYAFCNNKQGMMRRDLYISTPHTNIQNPLNRCRNLMMAISGRNM